MKTSLTANQQTSQPLRFTPTGPRGTGRLLCFILLLLNLGFLATAVAAPRHARIDGKTAHPTRLLVKYRQASPGAAEVLRQHSLKVRNQPTLVPRVAVLDVDEPAAALDAADETEVTRRLTARIEALRRSGQFEYVEPDWEVSISRTPTDSYYSQNLLWGLRNTYYHDADIGAEAAWDITTGSRDVIVAVIDTGIRHTHRDLAAQMWVNPGEIPNNGVDDDRDGYVDNVHGINAITGRGNPIDDNDHGTHVAGTIGAQANGGGGHVGVAWQVRLMGCKFLNSSGRGYDSDAIECINFAVRNGASILNNSWGGGSYNPAMYDAIVAARNAGVLFVAAAGNETSNNDAYPHYPSSYRVDNVISVASVTVTDDLSYFSNYGRTSVHIAAPGSTIWSCTAASDTSYGSKDGTSMATPHVAGVAALVRARFPGISVGELRTRILNSAVAIPELSGRCTTGGRVNAYRALTGSGNASNDHFSNATVLSGSAGSVTGSNVGATRQAGEPYHWSTTGGKSVWYRWTAPVSGVCRFETTGSGFDTILAVYAGASVGGLTRIVANDDAGGLQSLVQFRAQAGVTYRIAVDGYAAASGSIALRWSPGDLTPPTVTFLSPAAGTRLVSAVVTVTGTASDNVRLDRVLYRVNSGPWYIASGTTTWSGQASIPAGAVTVSVRSVDTSGNISQVITRSFTRVAAVQVATTTPAAEDTTAALAALASYSGLFAAGDEITHETSGSFTAQINGRGEYTGNLWWRGQRLAMSGKFALNGRATNLVAPSGLPAVRVELALHQNGVLTGHVGLGTQTATLNAHHAGFNAVTQPCPFAGRYTLAFAGHTNAAVYPGGHGTATILVDAAGTLSLTGTLGDGTPVSHTARLSRDGDWALHLPLYQGRGSLLGWMRFSSEGRSSVAGMVSWSRPPQGARTGGTYPAGFRFVTAGAGSRYVAPTYGQTLLSMTNGVVNFSGGTLSASFENRVLLGAAHRLINLDDNPLSLVFAPQTGRFTGQVTEPATGRVLSVSGVVLQDANLAAGCFRTGPATGAVVLAPANGTAME